VADDKDNCYILGLLNHKLYSLNYILMCPNQEDDVQTVAESLDSEPNPMFETTDLSSPRYDNIQYDNDCMFP